VSYHQYYHPLSWRGFHQFGGGQMADWFCHTADAPVWTLDLYEPTVIEAEEVMGGNQWMTPDGVRVRYEFPARGGKPPCTFYWGNGPVDKKPEGVEWTWRDKLPPGGSYLQGDKCNVHADSYSRNPRLANKERMREFKAAGYPAEKYPRVTGGPFGEWVRAIKGEGPEPGSNLEYASRLTQLSLLGVLATRVGGRIEWDAANFRITNRPELNDSLRDPVRKGWEYGEDLWKGLG
jgi:predicted dehydrogenase